MKDYIKIARVDHWIKQLFIVPGMIFALFLTRNPITAAVVKDIVLALISTSFVASANYVINEWLDAESDKEKPSCCIGESEISLGYDRVCSTWRTRTSDRVVYLQTGISDGTLVVRDGYSL